MSWDTPETGPCGMSWDTPETSPCGMSWDTPETGPGVDWVWDLLFPGDPSPRVV